MKFVIVFVLLAVTQTASASIFDQFQDTISAISNSFSNMLTAVIVDVRQTIDCTLLAVEQTFALGLSREYYEQRCHGYSPKVKSQLTSKKNEAPLQMNKNNNKNANDNIKVTSYNRKMENLKKVLQRNTNHLQKVSDLLKCELNNISDDLKNANNITGIVTPTFESVWNDIQILQQYEKKQVSGKKAKQIDLLIDQIMTIINEAESEKVIDKNVQATLIKNLETVDKTVYEFAKIFDTKANSKQPEVSHQESIVTQIEKYPKNLIIVSDGNKITNEENNTFKYETNIIVPDTLKTEVTKHEVISDVRKLDIVSDHNPDDHKVSVPKHKPNDLNNKASGHNPFQHNEHIPVNHLGIVPVNVIDYHKSSVLGIKNYVHNTSMTEHKPDDTNTNVPEQQTSYNHKISEVEYKENNYKNTVPQKQHVDLKSTVPVNIKDHPRVSVLEKIPDDLKNSALERKSEEQKSSAPEHKSNVREHNSTVPEHKYSVPEHKISLPEQKSSVVLRNSVPPEHNSSELEHNSSVPDHKRNHHKDTVTENIPDVHKITDVDTENKIDIYNNSELERKPKEHTSGLKSSVLEHKSNIEEHNSNMPDHNNSVLEHKNSVPEHNTNKEEQDSNLSEHKSSVLEHDNSVPEHKNSVPEHKSSVTEHDNSVPEHKINVPKLKGSVTKLKSDVLKSHAPVDTPDKHKSDVLVNRPNDQKSDAPVHKPDDDKNDAPVHTLDDQKSGAPFQIAHDHRSDAAVHTPDDDKNDTPVHISNDDKNDAPVHTPDGHKSDAPVHIPNGHKSDVPVHIPDDDKNDAPVQISDHHRSDAPVHTPDDDKNDTPVHISDDHKSDAPVHTLGHKSDDSVPSHISDDHKSDAPGHIPEEHTINTTVQIPNDHRSDALVHKPSEHKTNVLDQKYEVTEHGTDALVGKSVNLSKNEPEEKSQKQSQHEDKNSVSEQVGNPAPQTTNIRPGHNETVNVSDVPPTLKTIPTPEGSSVNLPTNSTINDAESKPYPNTTLNIDKNNIAQPVRSQINKGNVATLTVHKQVVPNALPHQDASNEVLRAATVALPPNFEESPVNSVEVKPLAQTPQVPVQNTFTNNQTVAYKTPNNTTQNRQSVPTPKDGVNNAAPPKLPGTHPQKPLNNVVSKPNSNHQIVPKNFKYTTEDKPVESIVKQYIPSVGSRANLATVNAAVQSTHKTQANNNQPPYTNEVQPPHLPDLFNMPQKDSDAHKELVANAVRLMDNDKYSNSIMSHIENNPSIPSKSVFDY